MPSNSKSAFWHLLFLSFPSPCHLNESIAEEHWDSIFKHIFIWNYFFSVTVSFHYYLKIQSSIPVYLSLVSNLEGACLRLWSVTGMWHNIWLVVFLGCFWSQNFSMISNDLLLSFLFCILAVLVEGVYVCTYNVCVSIHVSHVSPFIFGGQSVSLRIIPLSSRTDSSSHWFKE